MFLYITHFLYEFYVRHTLINITPPDFVAHYLAKYIVDSRVSASWKRILPCVTNSALITDLSFQL